MSKARQANDEWSATTHRRTCRRTGDCVGRGHWVLNEKRLIETAGLIALHALFAQVPIESASLFEWVDLVRDQLGVPRDEMTPWK